MVDGETGIVVADPNDAAAVAAAIDRLLSDPGLAGRQGQSARQRAETHFGYDVLAARLGAAIARIGAEVPP